MIQWTIIVTIVRLIGRLFKLLKHWCFNLGIFGSMQYVPDGEAKLSQSKNHGSGSPVLPIDLMENIADFLFEIVPTKGSRTGTTQASSICSMKPLWTSIAGFMGASVDLHNMGMERWTQVLICRSQEDLVASLQYARWTRELQCLENVFLDSQSADVLKRFTRLHTLSIDAHNDVWHNGSRFAYRDLFTSLPSSMRRLEVVHAHGPDARIIATVKRHCPGLRELRLGRCNMFNRAPACDFWRAFPFEHDSYISVDGTDDYANCLGQELASLRHLKVLQLGIYLAPTSIVLAHRIYHMNGLRAPESIDWQQAIPLARYSPETLDHAAPPELEHASPNQLIDMLHQKDSEQEFSETSCDFCQSDFLDLSTTAETKASLALRALVPSLDEIQWMGWFTPKHLGTKSYTFPIT